jgi:hypothetical protein
MATFLQICQDLRREAGGSGSGPVTVVGQTGDMADIVAWCQKAYNRIQTARRSWRWMWDEVAIPVIAADRTFTIADITSRVPAFTRWKHWKPEGFKHYVNSVGLAGERKIPERLFERAYEGEFGTVSTSSTPRWITVMPDGALRMSHIADAAATLTAAYYKKNQLLALDTDEPEMPEEYHDLIWATALCDFGYREAATEILARAEERKAELYSRLLNEQLEPVENYATTIGE